MDSKMVIGKKPAAGLYLFALSAFLCVVGAILFLRAVNLSQGKFYSTWNTAVILFTAASIGTGVLAAFTAFSKKVRGNYPVRDALSLISALCLALVIVFIAAATAEEIGVFYFSSLDSSNEAVIAAMGILRPALGIEAAALVSSLAGLFFKLNRDGL